MKTTSPLIIALLALGLGSCRMDTFYANKRIDHQNTEKINTVEPQEAATATEITEQKSTGSSIAFIEAPIPATTEPVKPVSDKTETIINEVEAPVQIEKTEPTVVNQSTQVKTVKRLTKKVKVFKKIKLPKRQSNLTAQQQGKLSDEVIYVLIGLGVILIVSVASMIAGSLGGGIMLIVAFIGLLFSIAGVIAGIYLLYLIVKFFTFDWLY